MRTIPAMLIVGGCALGMLAGVGCYRDAGTARTGTGTTVTTSGGSEEGQHRRLPAPEQPMGASGPGAKGGTGTSEATGVGMGSTGAGIVDSAGDLRKPDLSRPSVYGPTGIEYADAGK